MNRKTLQHMVGYAVGGSLVLILIPLGIFFASRSLDRLISVGVLYPTVLRYAVAVVLLAVGVVFGLSSIVIQNVKGGGGPVEFANIEISPRTQHLVVTGPYRCTRNPMLLGACAVYFAVAVHLNSVTAVAIVALFMVLMLVFVKFSEERRLLRDFGEEYERYRRAVPMFIPWPRGRATAPARR